MLYVSFFSVAHSLDFDLGSCFTAAELPFSAGCKGADADSGHGTGQEAAEGREA